MPGIYQRDNINYGGMLGNAMRERANYIQRDYENYMKQPTAWSNAVQNSGKIAQDALFSIGGKYLDNDLAKDKIGFQQQLQAEENARARSDALDRAREQQRWQSGENALSRASTEKIAMNKWEEAQEEKANVNKAKHNLDYQIQQSLLIQYEDALNHTQDPIKRRELEGKIASTKIKIKDYESLYPEFNPQPPVQEQTGNQGEAPVFSNEFLKEAGHEAPDDIMQNEKVKWSGFKEQLKNVKNSKEAATIIEGLKALNANQYFSEAEAQQLAADIEAAQAIYDKKKAGEIRYNEGMKKYKAAKTPFEKRQIVEEYGLKI